MKAILRIVFWVGLALAPLNTAQGQYHRGPHYAQPRQHETFWLGVTGGYAWARRTCDQCNPALETWSGSGSFRAGGTVSEQLLLGGEFATWYRASGGIKSWISNTSLVATYFPFWGQGLKLTGGLGVGTYQYRQNGATLKGIGLGLVGGVGYDIMVGRKTAVAPMVNFRYGIPGKLSRTKGGASTGVAPATGAKTTVIEFGLNLTFY